MDGRICAGEKTRMTGFGFIALDPEVLKDGCFFRQRIEVWCSRFGIIRATLFIDVWLSARSVSMSQNTTYLGASCLRLTRLPACDLATGQDRFRFPQHKSDRLPSIFR